MREDTDRNSGALFTSRNMDVLENKTIWRVFQRKLDRTILPIKTRRMNGHGGISSHFCIHRGRSRPHCEIGPTDRHFEPVGVRAATLVLGFSDAIKANFVRRSFHRNAGVSMVNRQSRRGIFRITRLVNDSSPHQPRPDLVPDGSREIRIVWPKQPVSEYFSWIAHSRIQLHCRAIRKNRLFIQAFLVTSRTEINDLLFSLRSRFVGDMRKGSGGRIKLLLRPVLGPLSHSEVCATVEAIPRGLRSCIAR